MNSSRAKKSAVHTRLANSATSDIDALDLAMGMKREDFDIFTDMARNAKNPYAKAVFEKIATGENLDYELLEQTKSSLENLSSKSIWEEGGPIEGG